jgi:hypothetical protein
VRRSDRFQTGNCHWSHVKNFDGELGLRHSHQLPQFNQRQAGGLSGFLVRSHFFESYDIERFYL